MRTSRLLLAMMLLLVAPRSADAVPPGDGCTYTAAYWTDHPDLWPVEQLEVGLIMRDKPELLSLLGTSGGKNLADLMRETIAAKLNVANGASDGIMPYITWADFILALGKDNSRRFRDLRGVAAINEVRRALADYNALGCNVPAARAQLRMEPLQDDASFGALKARF